MTINNHKWYMIATISGKEESVIESLKRRKAKEKIAEISDFYVAIVPHLTQTLKERKRNLYPGYIFIHMDINDDIWFVIRNTEYVTGLVGSSGQRTKPTPLSEAEMEKVRAAVVNQKLEFEQKLTKPQKLDYGLNDEVVVVRGPMQGQIGIVTELNEKANKVTIEIEVFGKRVPTQINTKSVAPAKKK